MSLLLAFECNEKLLCLCILGVVDEAVVKILVVLFFSPCLNSWQILLDASAGVSNMVISPSFLRGIVPKIVAPKGCIDAEFSADDKLGFSSSPSL